MLCSDLPANNCCCLFFGFCEKLANKLVYYFKETSNTITGWKNALHEEFLMDYLLYTFLHLRRGFKLIHSLKHVLHSIKQDTIRKQSQIWELKGNFLQLFSNLPKNQEQFFTPLDTILIDSFCHLKSLNILLIFLCRMYSCERDLRLPMQKVYVMIKHRRNTASQWQSKAYMENLL